MWEILGCANIQTSRGKAFEQDLEQIRLSLWNKTLKNLQKQDCINLLLGLWCGVLWGKWWFWRGLRGVGVFVLKNKGSVLGCFCWGCFLGVGSVFLVLWCLEKLWKISAWHKDVRLHNSENRCARFWWFFRLWFCFWLKKKCVGKRGIFLCYFGWAMCRKKDFFLSLFASLWLGLWGGLKRSV